ncbi:MAG: hypothetical protein AB7T63_07015 [Planctomycetota bacterium]
MRVGLLLLGLLAGWSASTGHAEPPSRDELAERLGSPVAEVRRRALDDLTFLPPDDACACVDAWAASPSPWLRAAAHAVRARCLRASDVEALLGGLQDPEACVARAAAESLLAAAQADRLGAGPPLPRSRALGPRALRALMLAFIARLEGAEVDDLGWILRLGEGAVAPLSLAAMDADDASRARRAALTLMARLGGLGARRGIAAGGPGRWTADLPVWCDAVLTAGPGPGFEEVEAWLDAVVLPTELMDDGFRPRRGRPPWRRPRANMAELLAQFAEGRRERVEAVLRDWVETQASGWWPPTRIQAVRAFLAVGEPSDADLEELVGASIPPLSRSARAGGMHDGLAEILRLLLPWRETSEALREEARRVSSRTLPPIHHAWLRYLADGSQAEGLADEALELLTGVPSHPERQRLAAFLLDRVGVAPPAALEAAAASDDGGLRAWAVYHRVRLPGDAGEAAAAEALLDPDDRVLLAGALSARVELGVPVRRRLVELAALGETPVVRRRAARALSIASTASRADGDSSEDLAEAGLDERLAWRHEALRALR